MHAVEYQRSSRFIYKLILFDSDPVHDPGFLIRRLVILISGRKEQAGDYQADHL